MDAANQSDASGAASRCLSLEEWAELPEDDRGELVRGWLMEEEMPSIVHEAVLAWLLRVLGVWGASTGARVFGSGVKYGVGALTGRLPDASVYLRGSKRPPPRGLVRIPPSIVVEVVSPSSGDARRDRVEKLAEYARFGVKWYWLVDPELRTFEIFELDATRTYRHLIGATDGAIDPVPGCEGLVLDIAALFHELDEIIAEGNAAEG